MSEETEAQTSPNKDTLPVVLTDTYVISQKTSPSKGELCQGAWLATVTVLSPLPKPGAEPGIKYSPTSRFVADCLWAHSIPFHQLPLNTHPQGAKLQS